METKIEKEERKKLKEMEKVLLKEEIPFKERFLNDKSFSIVIDGKYTHNAIWNCELMKIINTAIMCGLLFYVDFNEGNLVIHY